MYAECKIYSVQYIYVLHKVLKTIRFEPVSLDCYAPADMQVEAAYGNK